MPEKVRLVCSLEIEADCPQPCQAVLKESLRQALHRLYLDGVPVQGTEAVVMRFGWQVEASVPEDVRTMPGVSADDSRARVCTACGGSTFSASQRLCADVEVTGRNEVLRAKTPHTIDLCREGEDPEGPWTCETCGARYRALDDLTEA